MTYQPGQNETWNRARAARELVGEAIDKLAEFYGTLILDTDIMVILGNDGLYHMITTPIEETRDKLREASCALTDIMVSEKAEAPSSPPDADRQR